MKMTKKQRKLEELAKFHDTIAGGPGKSLYAKQYRSKNRKVDKRK